MCMWVQAPMQSRRGCWNRSYKQCEMTYMNAGNWIQVYWKSEQVLCSSPFDHVFSPHTHSLTWPLPINTTRPISGRIIWLFNQHHSYMIRDRATNWLEEIFITQSWSCMLGVSCGDHCLVTGGGIAKSLFKKWMEGLLAGEEHKCILNLGWDERAKTRQLTQPRTLGSWKS